MDDIAALRAEVAALRAEVDRLRPQASPAPPAVGSPSYADEPLALSRRGLLARAGAVAAGGFGLAMVAARPAAATTGTMQYGVGGATNYSGNVGTGLQSVSSDTTLDVFQGGDGAALVADVTNTSSTADAMRVVHNGLGTPLDVSILNNSNTGQAIYAYAGTGGAAGIKAMGTPGVSGLDIDGGTQGVYGESGTGLGVYGFASETGSGVRGVSVNGKGLEGFSSANYGGWLHGAKAPLFLDPGTVAGHPTSGAHLKGEVYVDSLGRHWICLVSGTPGTWARPGFNAITAVRRLSGSTSAGVFSAGQAKDVQVAAVAGVPGAASSVVLSVTAYSTANGSVTVYPTGAARPGVIHLSFGSAYLWTSQAICAVGSGSKVRLYNSAGTTKLWVDLLGYFV